MWQVQVQAAPLSKRMPPLPSSSTAAHPAEGRRCASLDAARLGAARRNAVKSAAAADLHGHVGGVGAAAAQLARAAQALRGVRERRRHAACCRHPNLQLPAAPACPPRSHASPRGQPPRAGSCSTHSSLATHPAPRVAAVRALLVGQQRHKRASVVLAGSQRRERAAAVDDHRHQRAACGPAAQLPAAAVAPAVGRALRGGATGAARCHGQQERRCQAHPFNARGRPPERRLPGSHGYWPAREGCRCNEWMA